MALDADHPVTRFQSMFLRVNSDTELDLESLYTEDVQFVDPFHAFKGRDKLQAYFDRLGKRTKFVEFNFGIPVVNDFNAALPWTMRARAKGFPKIVEIDGISHLRFTGRIAYHRDYFDVGALTIEQIPGVGQIFRWLKGLA
jgi:limonene-1,2-epoxide hydrolase